jgi:hypothetical protein
MKHPSVQPTSVRIPPATMIASRPLCNRGLFSAVSPLLKLGPPAGKADASRSFFVGTLMPVLTSTG